jgi:hypothetical protein
MPLRTEDRSSPFERALQSKVYDLHSASVALDMQEVFARSTNQLLPLLAQVAGETIAKGYRGRFSALMDEYERLGMPKRLGDGPSRAYLAKVRQFGDDLRAYIEAAHPIKVEFSRYSVPRS